jgi:hypothetical protein
MTSKKASSHPTPPFEKLRLESLKRLTLLDSGLDPFFDELVRIATMVAGIPIGALSLVDQDMQWFKAKVGLDVCETSRYVSFCTHAIMETKALNIGDALEDE